MRFILTINMDNSAFGDTGDETALELARILRGLAAGLNDRKVASLIRSGCGVRDANGNRVGRAYIEAKEDCHVVGHLRRGHRARNHRAD